MFELYQKGTGTWIAVMLVMLIITLIAYSIVPMVIASTRKKPITKTKYRTYCYILNFLILLLLIVINDSAVNGWPYILWTSVFAGSGLKKLREKGLLKEPQETQEDWMIADPDEEKK